MQEIFKNIRTEVKETAEAAWNLAMAQNNPIRAAEFLNTVTEYYRNVYTDEEIEFLQFYFHMKVEMINE